RIRALGYDSFEPQPAGVLQHRRARFLEVVAVSDRAIARLAGEALQFGLALDQGQFGEIAAIEMKEIEDVIQEALALSGLERGLQSRKTRNAARIKDHHLAVDERGARRQLGDRRGDVGELAGPVQTLAGEQADLAAVESGLDAIAVELDLMHPARPAGSSRAQGSERWRHEIR